MKTIKLLIPSLVALSATPLITLSNCNPEPAPDEATFYIASAYLIDTKRGRIVLDWTPGGNAVEINNITFTYNDGVSAKIGGIIQDQSLSILLTFSEDITEDIDDGILSFHYVDNTAKTKGDKIISNINIRNGEISFSFDHTTMEAEKNGAIVLNYSPGSDEIEIDGKPTLTYTFKGEDKTADVRKESTIEGQLILPVWFDEEITEDITDGELSFKYINKTTGFSDYCTIKNIAFDWHSVDFSSVGWSKVIQPCDDYEKGIINEEQFCKKFYFKDSQGHIVEPTSFDDFIGQTKRVKINGISHDTIVIDQNKDTISGTDKKAALTFQFQNLVSDKDGNAITTNWDTTNNRNYWESQLCVLLNNDKDDEVESVYEMIKHESGNGNLWKAIKPVSITVNTYVTEKGEYEPITRPTKLFQPTINNIFSDKGIDVSEAGISGPEYLTPEHKLAYKAEGDQYKYYQNKIGDNPFYQLHYYKDLTIFDLNKKSPGYWLTSPSMFLPDIYKFAWMMLYSKDGSYANQNYCYSVSRGLAPCFCI